MRSCKTEGFKLNGYKIALFLKKIAKVVSFSNFICIFVVPYEGLFDFIATLG